MTLIEIMIAAAIALILILAVIRIYVQSAEIIADGRAEIELAGQIRRVGHQLREDLNRATIATRPWPGEGGYVEIFEGPNWDGTNINPPMQPADTLLDPMDPYPPQTDDVRGDIDDMLMFTAYSPDRPFVGRFVQKDGMGIVVQVHTIESPLAEIVWWARLNNVPKPLPMPPPPLVDYNKWDPRNEDYSLYRRVLLIRPDLALNGWSSSTPAEINDFYTNNDISARLSGGGGFIANSSADLTRRENRWFHNPGLFPHVLNWPFFFTTRVDQAVGAGAQPIAIQIGDSEGDDVILPRVFAFDVKILDPTAPVRATAGRALEPGDPGFLTSGSTVGQGAYVDLGYQFAYPGYGGVSSRFSGNPHGKSQLTFAATGGRTYCTWSSHYERDGIDQDDGGAGPFDEGTDGLDNDGNSGVDDGGEQETSPHYPFPLRAIQVKIRIADVASQNVRQVTVQSDFTPE